MNKKLLNWYISKKTDQVISKTPHYCEDCHKTDLAIRQVSLLYLLGYVIIGVITGIFVAWWAGVMATLICLYISIKLAKRSCKHCGSHRVHIKISETTVSDHE